MGGVCNGRYPYECVCYDDSLRGHWDGAKFGGPCDKCSFGWWGPRCLSACKGGACNPCSGNGLCTDGVRGDGNCKCFSNQFQGYWTAEDCSQCQPEYAGEKCNIKCYCHGHGACDSGRRSTGRCICVSGYGAESNCALCAPNSHGSNCQERCEGSVLGTERPCSGHGNCTNTFSNQRDHTCTSCDTGFAGSMCQFECPGNCNGHGVCSQGLSGTGTCTCNRGYAPPDCAKCERVGYWGPTCEQICPGGPSNPCSDLGKCSVSTGKCECNFGYAGQQCELVCPRVDKIVCGRGGVCDPENGTCACFGDLVRGFWVLTPDRTCNQCQLGYAGMTCNEECPILNNKTCNGHPCVNRKCICPEGLCGIKCEVMGSICKQCPAGAPGLVVHKYGLQCERTCTCNFNYGTCDEGVNGTGKCTCVAGWAGMNCDKQCDGGFENPCSRRGFCKQEDGSCVCDPGYAGYYCQFMCRRSPSGEVCYGHGKCDEGSTGRGMCECTSEYVGDACDLFCSCAAHGRCDLSGKCTCLKNWAGDRCHECLKGWSGPSCTQRCVLPNGITSGTSCTCFPTYGGLDCSSQCMKNGTNGTLCGSRGNCSDMQRDGNNSTGRCVCNAPWQGPACDCSLELCRGPPYNLVNPACDQDTGRCICNSRYSGSTCTECNARKFFGSGCEQPCECGHGTCDETGQCKCDSDPVLGFWQQLLSPTCTSCDSQYMGDMCTIRVVPSTEATGLTKSLLIPGRQTLFSSSMLLDNHRSILIAGGDALVWFNVSKANIPEGNAINMSLFDNCPSSTVSKIWLDPVTREYRYLLQPDPTCKTNLRIMAQTHVNAKATLLREYDTIIAKTAAINVKESTVCRISSDLKLWCAPFGKNLSAADTKMTLFSLSRFLTVVDVTYFEKMDTIAAPGVTSGAGGILWDIALFNITGVRYVVSQLADLQIAQKYVEVHVVAGFSSTVFFAVMSKTKEQITAPDIVRFEWGDGFWSIKSIASQLDTLKKYKGTLITLDFQRNVGYVIFEDHLRLLKMTKWKLNETFVYSVQSVQPRDTGTVALANLIDAQIDNENLMLYYLLKEANGVAIVRYLLWEVEAVEPTWADAKGGTVIHLKGNGFSPLQTIRCSVMGSPLVTPATYISPTTVACIAPTARSSGCTSETIELSIDGVSFTDNKVVLQRTDSPRLRFASPSAGSLTGGVIMVHGEGFRRTKYITCYFRSNTANATVFATFVSNNLIRCEQPLYKVPTSSPATLAVSLDGQILSGGPIPFAVVGAAVNISIRSESYEIQTVADTHIVKSFTIESDLISKIPTYRVFVIDAEGNSVEGIDTVARRTFRTDPLASRNSQKQMAMFYAGCCGTLNRSSNEPYSGYADFTDTFLRNPIQGDLYFRLSSDQPGWTFTVQIKVLPGMVRRLQTVREPTPVTTGKELETSPILEGLDHAGNIAVASERWYLQARVLSTNPRDQNRRNFSKTISPKDKVIVDMIGMRISPHFGAMYKLEFILLDSLTGKNLTSPIESVEIEPKCPGDQKLSYWVPYWLDFQGSTGFCMECPETALCNGTNYTMARNGYWRAPRSEVDYQCQSSTVCVNGSCARGYAGPICGTCEIDYALNIRRECVPCKSPDVDAVYIFVTLLVVFLVLFIVVFVFVSNAFTYSNFHIVLQMYFSYVQMMTYLSYLRLNWSESMLGIFSAFGIVVDMRTKVVSSFECVLRRNGYNFTHLYMMYVILSFLFSIMISYVLWTLWRRRPQIFSCLDSLVDKSTKTRDGENGARPELTYTFRGLLLSSLMAVMWMTYQATVFHFMELLPCREFVVDTLGMTQSYLAVDLSVDCGSASYRSFRVGMGFLAFTYGFGVPLGFVLGHTLYTRQAHHSQITRFMLLGLRAQVWWWQGLVMLRKLLLITVVVFITEPPIDTYLFMWSLIIFLVTHVYVRPYVSKAHNHLETFGFAITICTCNLALLDLKSPDNVKWVIQIGIVVIQLFAQCYFLYFMLKKIQMLEQEEHWTVHEFEEGKDVNVGEIVEEMQDRQKVSNKDLHHHQKGIPYVLETFRVRDGESYPTLHTSVKTHEPSPLRSKGIQREIRELEALEDELSNGRMSSTRLAEIFAATMQNSNSPPNSLPPPKSTHNLILYPLSPGAKASPHSRRKNFTLEDR